MFETNVGSQLSGRSAPMGFRDIPQPFVCGVLVDDSTVDGVTRTMKLAAYEG
jgi:hypothetical protein